ncbi:hypothetical protein IU431_00490 [Nocardia otitidiscaviarum]|uniref:hypothetical protein n=1 Tax=Nocardia otitidiscaviarum TaxID=1823 RepID=UPI000ACE6381|nr:hypothetical protein [Nocardia otitidiscaviarum]MBF6482645.1 hypothetical protein [Nocardia otitidiscaviarum]
MKANGVWQERELAVVAEMTSRRFLTPEEVHHVARAQRGSSAALSGEPAGAREREPAHRLRGLLYRLVCGSSVNAGGTPRHKAAPAQIVAEWRPVAAALTLWGLARWIGPDTLEATEAGVEWIAADLRLRGVELTL